MNHRIYNSIEEIREANQAIGNHWFDADTMAFFNSVIESSIINRCMFISSERMNYMDAKMYTIRIALPSGQVQTLSDFQQFNSLDYAIDYASNLSIDDYIDDNGDFIR